MHGIYDDPLVWDILNSPGTAAEASMLERLALRFGAARNRRRLVFLEPACGTGRYLRVLARRGHRVVGFDSSPTMIAYARRRLSSAPRGRWRLFEADLERFAGRMPSRSVDLAFNLHNSIRHLASDRAVRFHLRDIARVLRPGGIYALGISLSEYGRELPEEDTWTGRRGRTTVHQLVQYLPPGTAPPRLAARRAAGRTEWVVSHLALERPSGVEHRDAVYPLRCYDAGEWRRLLARSPLQHVATVNGFGDPIAARATPYAIDLLQR